MISLTHLIPCYNTDPHHLMECVNSIITQSSDQILIVDDGSTNPLTVKTIEFIASIYPQVKPVYLNENVGAAEARNIGLQHITTEYTALMDSSDIALPGKYQEQVAALLSDRKIDVIGTGLTGFKGVNRTNLFNLVHPKVPTLKYMKGHNVSFIVNHGTVIYRNEAVKAVGGYNKDFRRGHDVELWSRMWKNGAKFRNIEKILYLWRR